MKKEDTNRINEQKSWEDFNTKEKTLLIINLIVSFIGAYIIYRLVASIIDFVGGSSWITWVIAIFCFFVFYGTITLVQNGYEAVKKAANK